MYKRESKENQMKKTVMIVISMLVMFLLMTLSGSKNIYAAGRPISDGYYMIQSGNSYSRVLDINNASLSNGGNLEIYQKNQTTNQIFYVQYRGNGYYSIRAVHSGLYLHRKENDNVHQWSGYSSYNAQWEMRYANNVYYYLRNRANGKYLDNSKGSTQLGNNVIVYSLNYGTNQKWRFIRVNKPSFTLKVTNNNAPQGWYRRSTTYRVSGTVASTYPVTKMVMEVYDLDGNRTYAGREGSPNMTNFKYQFTLYFSHLRSGKYYYQMTGYNALGDAVQSRRYYFTVY